MRDRGSLLLGQSTGEAKIASTGHVRVSADEKRRFIRNPVPLQIQVIADEDAFSAHVIDISAGGARLVCALVPRIGAAIELDIAEFGRVAGKVVRRFPYSFAVAFDIDAETQLQLTDCLTAAAARTVEEDAPGTQCDGAGGCGGSE